MLAAIFISAFMSAKRLYAHIRACAMHTILCGRGEQ